MITVGFVETACAGKMTVADSHDQTIRVIKVNEIEADWHEMNRSRLIEVNRTENNWPTQPQLADCNENNRSRLTDVNRTARDWKIRTKAEWLQETRVNRTEADSGKDNWLQVETVAKNKNFSTGNSGHVFFFFTEALSATFSFPEYSVQDPNKY